jgi:hypothetical protein
MKIWTCYDGLPQQDWWWTGDNRIALTNQGMCLDLTDGNLSDGNQLQVWQCNTGNTNQWVQRRVSVECGNCSSSSGSGPRDKREAVARYGQWPCISASSCTDSASVKCE